MSSLFKKIQTLAKTGIDPVREGMKNYHNPKDEIEALAAERLETCKGCPLFVDEPIKAWQIADIHLPEASYKMCDDCGCAIPYLIRQTQKICKKWEH